LEPDTAGEFINFASNSLEHLMDNATEDELYRTFGSLAEKNLTNDYGSKYSLYANNWPMGQTLPCDDFCAATDEVKATRIKYFYFPAESYMNKVIEVETEDGLGVSVLKWGVHSSWVVEERSESGVSVDMNKYGTDTKNFAVIAFAVFNYGLEDGNFTIRVLDAEIEEVIDSGLDLSFDDNCVRFKIDDLFAGIRRIYAVIEELGDAEGVLTGEFDREVMASRGNIPFEYMTICVYPVRSGATIEEVRNVMRRVVGGWSVGMSIGDIEMRASYDVVMRRSKMAYYLPMGEERVIMMIATD
jgi:hypothetical protein